MKLTNHTILITGGTSGIGLAFAKAFAEKGNTVIVVGRSQARIDAVLAENSLLTGLSADVSDEKSLKLLTKTISKDFPALDVLINSAGIMRAWNLFDEAVTTADLTSEINTNLIGTIAMTKAFLPLLEKNNGTVINITSGFANISDGVHPVYNATKAAIRFFTESINAQALYFGKNVTAVEIAPPLISETNLEDKPSDGTPDMSLADFIAESFAGLEAGDARISVGIAKNLYEMGKTDVDENTAHLSADMMASYFPKEGD